ncbi:MAG: DUF3108 domain-containing protein [Candidatus Omnitrophota bacterium]
MKKMLFILFVAFLLLACVFNYNNNPAIIIRNAGVKAAADTGFIQLRYRLYLLGVLPVAEAYFQEPLLEDYKGTKVYHLRAKAVNLGWVSPFFSGQVDLDSYIDASNFNPLLFRQRGKVRGRNDMNKEVLYDQVKGVMSIGEVRRQILANTQDPLSAVFNLRRMDFAKNKSFEMSLNTNQKNYVLEGEADLKYISAGREKYKATIVKAEIRRRDKNPYHKSNIDMVLLNEKNNMPVLIKVFASGLFLNAKLVEVR